jgi:hypothetical protein
MTMTYDTSQLAAPYGPSDWECEAADAEAQDRIRLCIRYGGGCHSSYASNASIPKVSICVRGRYADLSVDPKQELVRRYYVVTLSKSFEIGRTREFQLYGEEGELVRFSEYIDDLEVGTVVLVVAPCLKGPDLDPAAKRALRSIGCNVDEEGKDGSMLLVGCKGISYASNAYASYTSSASYASYGYNVGVNGGGTGGSANGAYNGALMVTGKSQETISLQCRVPALGVPLAVELRGDTMQVGVICHMPTCPYAHVLLS